MNIKQQLAIQLVERELADDRERRERSRQHFRRGMLLCGGLAYGFAAHYGLRDLGVVNGASIAAEEATIRSVVVGAPLLFAVLVLGVARLALNSRAIAIMCFLGAAWLACMVASGAIVAGGAG